MPESLVEKLSVRKCITVNENDNLKLAINLLATHKIGALPVINSKKRIVGIVSERDIINFFSSQNNREILSKKINSIMTKDVITCGINARSDELMIIMTKYYQYMVNKHIQEVVNGYIIQQQINLEKLNYQYLKIKEIVLKNMDVMKYMIKTK